MCKAFGSIHKKKKLLQRIKIVESKLGIGFICS